MEYTFGWYEPRPRPLLPYGDTPAGARRFVLHRRDAPRELSWSQAEKYRTPSALECMRVGDKIPAETVWEPPHSYRRYRVEVALERIE